jgi:nucleobase:cation symporter-1, NCS1 family
VLTQRSNTDFDVAGFARAVQGSSNNNGWDHIYQIAYFYGFVTSFTTYYLFYLVFPQERQHGTSPFVLDLQPEIITGADALSDQRIDIVVTGEKKTDGREV